MTIKLLEKKSLQEEMMTVLAEAERNTRSAVADSLEGVNAKYTRV